MSRKTLMCFLITTLLATGFLTACGTTQTDTTTVVNTVTSTATTTGTTPPTVITTTAKSSWWDQFGTPVYDSTLNTRAWPGLDQMFYGLYIPNGFGGYSAFGLYFSLRA